LCLAFYYRPDQIDEIAETALKIAQEGIGATGAES